MSSPQSHRAAAAACLPPEACVDSLIKFARHALVLQANVGEREIVGKEEGEKKERVKERASGMRLWTLATTTFALLCFTYTTAVYSDVFGLWSHVQVQVASSLSFSLAASPPRVCGEADRSVVMRIRARAPP